MGISSDSAGDSTGYSVIVPTYDRLEILKGCLAALVGQTFPRDRFEVIVVNDGGPTPLPSPEVAAALAIRVLHQANGGPGHARNHGAREARFNHLAFTDDDCRPAPEWLVQLDEARRSHPAAMVGGCTENLFRANLFAETSQTVVDAAYRWHNPDPLGCRFLASNNMACPREQFLAIGGFDETFRTAEDRDLCDRWLRADGRIVYASTARIGHAHSLGLVSFWNQHVSYGHGAYHFHRERLERGGEVFRPDWRFGLLLIRESFRQGRGFRQIMVAMLSLLSQVASLVGYLKAWKAARR